MRRARLTRARKAAGYTQENLAEALHIDRTTVHRWESGRNEPLPYMRPKLAKLLGITRQELEELFEGSIGRHEFLSIATVADVAIAHELAASISGKDAGPLAQIQTSYATDHAIATKVDVDTKHTLRRWAVELAEPIARVNATGHSREAG